MLLVGNEYEGSWSVFKIYSDMGIRWYLRNQVGLELIEVNV